MRPVEVQPEQIYEAGKALQELGRKVTGFALRKHLGQGSPERLMRVWEAHLLTIQGPAPSPEVHDLPLEIEDALRLGSEQIAQSMRALAENTQRIAVRLAERRVAEIHADMDRERQDNRIELKDASDTLDDLERLSTDLRKALDDTTEQLAQAQRQHGALVAENKQLTERLAEQAKALAEGESRQKGLQAKLDAAEGEAAKAKQSTAVVQDRLTTITGKHDQLLTAHQALQEQLGAARTEVSVANEKAALLSERIQDFERRAGEHRAELERSQQANHKLEQQLEKADQRYAQVEQRLAGVEEHAADLQKQLTEQLRATERANAVQQQMAEQLRAAQAGEQQSREQE